MIDRSLKRGIDPSTFRNFVFIKKAGEKAQFRELLRKLSC
jgi:hypothetical protein